MTAVIDWTAPCPRCGQPATWRSHDPGMSKTLAPLAVCCPGCDVATLGVWTEPPTPLPATAPKVSSVLACIARRMLFGATA